MYREGISLMLIKNNHLEFTSCFQFEMRQLPSGVSCEELPSGCSTTLFYFF